MIDNGPYCRVFLDHRGPTDAIERLLCALLPARLTHEGVITDDLEMVIDHGDNYPPLADRDYSIWINWKFSLEVYPRRQEMTEAEFALPVRTLLEKLHTSGVKAVPACDFEELLAPWNLVNAAN